MNSRSSGAAASGRLGALTLLTALLVAGCSVWRPAVAPMVQLAYAAPCAPASDAPHPLLVLLPGRFMRIGEFVEEGFVDAVRQRGIAADLLLVDAHLGYYAERSILDRLKADVFEPARQRGVTEVWVAGISLGAFGAILYGDTHPRELAGLVALGPYLGEPRTSKLLRADGGLRTWTPPAEMPPLSRGAAIDDVEVRIWRWLKDQTTDPLPKSAAPVFLGYGEDDRFGDAHRVLAEALPADRVATHPGGHDWEAWRPLWGQLLDRLTLPRRSGCTDTVATATASAAVAADDQSSRSADEKQ